ncbi:MAG: alanine--tRNA ligase [Chloroflexi bacterium]|nr:alanine--tRNA ligase [Chloroflexota bacterium]
MTGDEIRESFLRYFESQGHLRVASSSLIPVGDSTLLLTNAGMVQFKPYFTGEATPPNRRLTTAQKAFRTVDIDEVGDATHLTLFEMLGNFSIGNYFKKEAIDFALEFVTKNLGLPQERFSATIYLDDDESYDLWLKVGIPAERIYRFGDQDNWWGPAGLEGPCGPCSELHYDFGADRGCGKVECAPNCANVMNEHGDVCNRYVELWNLVFMQFYLHLDGSRPPLPAPSVDTGMGLERAAVILQNVDTIYKTDLFKPIIQKVEELSDKPYGKDHDTDYAMHAVAEHSRSATFLIADGVVPGNEGRGYVLRRVVRRAIRQARQLGIEGDFLTDVAEVAIGVMGKAYPEQVSHREFVHTVLRLEEERFQQAFERGNAMLTDALGELLGQPPDQLLGNIQNARVSGDLAFKLWDTFGFPVEMTQEIAREKSVDVDMDGFETAMAAQRDRARAGGKFGGDRTKIRVYETLGVGATKFLGYEQLTSSSVIVGLLLEGEAVTEASEGDEVEVVLVETPFYAEGGGQIGDAGEMVGPGGRIKIDDTQTVMPDVIAHFGTVAQGKVALGDTVDSFVDEVRREDTARNHTATHMLHAALRQVLGPHVRQAGSLVAPDRLRFDFSHVQAVTQDELRQVQLLVNEKVRQNARVLKDEDTYSTAIQRGALAFFGDKYGDRVRLIEIANGETFSFEVCGGTHVSQTGELGAIYVLGESSIGAGMRRIEAVSGRAAERMVWDRFAREERIVQKLQTSLSDVETRVDSLIEETGRLAHDKQALERKLSLQDAEGLLESKQDVDGIAVLAARATAPNADALRETGDWLRDKMGSGVVVLGSVLNDRPMLIAMVTHDLVEKGLDATEIVRGAAKAIQGGGGGRPDVAQAGGKLADKLDEALGLVAGLVREKRLIG